MKKGTIFMVFILMLSILAPYIITNSMVSSYSPKPTIYIEKIDRSMLVGDTFDINITVTDVKNLNSFTIYLRYNAAILQYLDAKNGNFWSEVGGKFERFNDPIGDLKIHGGFPSQPATGSGTLAIITFHCTGEGKSDLTLHDTELVNSTDRKIDHELYNGSCTQTTEVENSIPITSNYTLHTDLNSTLLGSVFIIEADNVVLNFNDHLVWATALVGTAVEIKGRSNVTIMNGNLASFQRGIIIQDCSNISIANVNISRARTTGIAVSDVSSNVHIVKNEIYGQLGESGEGIEITENSKVNISANDILYFRAGISIKDSNNSKISGNKIQNNRCGIDLENSFENEIWSNDFVKNIDTRTGKPNHAHCKNSRNNWNTGYPCGGNYWDDYGLQFINDSVSGKDHTISGPDGIGDTAYRIVSEGLENRDEYPLTHNCGDMLRLFSTDWVVSGPLIKETRTLSASVYTDCCIGDFDFNRTAGCLSFNIDQSNRNGTFFRAIISRELLDGALEVLVDNDPVASFLDSDETHAFAYFNYTSGSRVEIVGKIITKIDGDVNSDGNVDILDISIVAKNFGNKIEEKR